MGMLLPSRSFQSRQPSIHYHRCTEPTTTELGSELTGCVLIRSILLGTWLHSSVSNVTTKDFYWSKLKSFDAFLNKGSSINNDKCNLFILCCILVLYQ